jgi:hypothetical protein
MIDRSFPGPYLTTKYPMGIKEWMQTEQFKRRLDRLGLPRKWAADRLGLSLRGLFKQLNGDRRVRRQTELLLGHLEREQAQQNQPRRRNRKAPVAVA